MGLAALLPFPPSRTRRVGAPSPVSCAAPGKRHESGVSPNGFHLQEPGRYPLPFPKTSTILKIKTLFHQRGMASRLRSNGPRTPSRQVVSGFQSEVTRMKVVLFCGGAGMRLRGYVDDVPKPMVQIGTRPILWHLMKYYAHFGHKDFILCLGYKGNVIKDYFLHYDEAVSNDFVWSQGGKKVQFLNRDIDDWTHHLRRNRRQRHHRRTAESCGAVPRRRRDVPGQLWRRLERPGTAGDDRRPSSRATPSLRCFWCSRRPVSTSCRWGQAEPSRRYLAPLTQSDIWINGGFFVLPQ